MWVPIANQPDSDWNPTTRLEDWLEAAARARARMESRKSEQRINPEDHGASVRIVSEMMRSPLLTSGSVVSPNPGQALVRFLPEWTGPTTTITPGDSVRVIARRLITTLNMIGQHRATTTWQRRMRFRGLKFDSDTSGAAAVFATVRSGAARRNQEI